MAVAALLGSVLDRREDPPANQHPTHGEPASARPASSHGISAWLLFVIFLGVIIVIAIVIWIVGAHLRARRLGLPAPTFASYFSRGSSSSARGFGGNQAGMLGWVKDKVAGLRNKRTAGGAYEEPLGGFSGGATRGLDPDEAWDTRVGQETDGYETAYGGEEIGLSGHDGKGPYGGLAPPGYGEGVPAEGRGRSRSRGLEGSNEGYAEVPDPLEENPFADGAERSDMSLRGVSPRPMDGGGDGHENGGKGGERRSRFGEGDLR